MPGAGGFPREGRERGNIAEEAAKRRAGRSKDGEDMGETMRRGGRWRKRRR
jgi:hypothetical protein